MDNKLEETTPAERWNWEKDYVLPQELIEDFINQVDELAKKVFGAERTQDVPVDIKVIDRTRYERMHYHPVPYDHKANTDKEMEWVVETLLMNLKKAADQMDQMMQIQKRRKLTWPYYIKQAGDMIACTKCTEATQMGTTDGYVYHFPPPCQ